MSESAHEPGVVSVLEDAADFEPAVRRLEQRPHLIRNLLERTRQLAEEIAARPNLGNVRAPLDDLRRLGDEGLLTAPLPWDCGGLGLGSEEGGHLPLLQILVAIGGADLALGRLYEGHVNALVLIAAFGDRRQLERAAREARSGLLFGVWNTGDSEPMQLVIEAEGAALHGRKMFASGAGFVLRPVVTAALADGGWQMTLPRMDATESVRATRLDTESWHPLGMEASESYAITLAGVPVAPEDWLGAAGSFYEEPLFRGGAIRFAAVQAGTVLRLHRMLVEWLEHSGRSDDPYQIARLGEVALLAQQAVFWIERAGEVAEDNLSPRASEPATMRMLECANMTRVAIERIASATMERVIAGVGARGLLQPSRFERMLRDLTMYLRQPGPDHALAQIGRDSIAKSRLGQENLSHGVWRGGKPAQSLRPEYFDRIYEESPDPWNFEHSEYEANKYRETLDCLPRQLYANALEVGCSIGVLTQKLSARCCALLSIDVSLRALERAAERCAGLDHVRFACVQLPEEAPAGEFDLVVVSEVGYYWQRDDLARAITLLAERQPTGGHLVLVHFTEFVEDYPLTGDEVHAVWLARREWKTIHHSRQASYRLDVLERVDD